MDITNSRVGERTNGVDLDDAALVPCRGDRPMIGPDYEQDGNDGD